MKNSIRSKFHPRVYFAGERKKKYISLALSYSTGTKKKPKKERKKFFSTLRLINNFASRSRRDVL